MMLKNKTIIVTGGNSGIGEAIVLAAAAEGANVIVDYLDDPGDLDTIVAQAEKAGGHAVGVQADVSLVPDLHKLVSAAVEHFGRLDIMINNAGMETRTSLLDSTVEDFDRVIAVDLKSAYFGTQLAAKQFIAQGGGGVVLTVSSIHEDWPMAGNIAYCVAKGGAKMLTRTAGVELGQHGIRCVNIAPGAVSTHINDATMGNADDMAKLNASIPAGRMATAEEIADVAVFLASDGAAYLTATTVTVDGGMTMAGPGL